MMKSSTLQENDWIGQASSFFQAEESYHSNQVKGELK